MTNVYNWSTTPADNDDADGSLWPEGMAPSQVNNSARDNMASLARFLSDIGGKTATTGSSNAYVFTPATPIAALADGLVICIRANHTNTGAATINVNALGAKKIRRFDDSGDIAIAANDILSGNHYLLQYDEAIDGGAGGWVLLNPSLSLSADAVSYDDTNAYAGAENVQEALEESANYTGYVENETTLQNFVYGLTLSNNSTDANNDIDITTGQARGNSITVTNSATLTKRLDASWAEGTNQGGLDTGSKANSTTYHVHAIRKDTDGTFDALFSTSASSPTVPSGWTYVQRLGSVMTDGSGNIRPFLQDGNAFRLRIAAGLTAYNATGSRATALLSCPLPVGVRVLGLFTATLACGSTPNPADTGRMTLADGNDSTVLSEFRQWVVTGGNGGVTFFARDAMCRTNASAQIYLGIQNGDGSHGSSVVVRGWVDESIPRIGA